MKLLALASIPLALVGAWAAWRALAGRPVRRFALNAVVGILLLSYFAITASLGIFWVANQELPVFDPHYLFGYLTLLLVAVHVVINAPLLARFFRKRSRALSADGQTWRPSVRWIGRVLATAAFGGLCFWLGWSRGASYVRVERGEPVQPPSAAPAQAGMPEEVITGEGERHPLSRWYHDHSKLSRTRAIVRGPSLDVSTRPDPFETYPAEAVVPLPANREPIARATGAALDSSRHGATALGPLPVSVAQLATLLHLTQGITSVTGLPTDPFHRRAAASSGALYPTVTHVVVSAVDGLAPGLYHYEPRTHALHRLRSGDAPAELVRTIAHPHAVAEAPFTLVFSSIYYKSSWKYQERGYRYCLLDAGHVAANAIVAGYALGFASRPIARFDDAALGKLLAIVPHRQGPFLVVPFGAPLERVDADEPVFEPTDLALADDRVPEPVMLVASRTALRRTERRTAPFVASPPIAPRARGTPIPLAPSIAGGEESIDQTIERRRSERRFGDAPLTAAQLGAVLRRAHSASVEDQRALRLHVIVSRVEGVPAGAYEVHADSLTLVRGGDLSSDAHGVALLQEVAGNAAVVLVLSVDATRLAWPDASRGYRYGWLDAGIAAGRVYLMAVALGIGASSIGAFFDDDVSDLLRLDPRADYPALLVALGTKGG